MSTTVETGTAIRPFSVEFPEEAIDDLRRRVTATRWPSKELVPDRSQGVQLATAQALARYWLDEYDFGRNALMSLHRSPKPSTTRSGGPLSSPQWLSLPQR